MFKINLILAFKRNLTISTHSTHQPASFKPSLFAPILDNKPTSSSSSKQPPQAIKCPSLKIFQLPLDGIRIIDILKRQDLTLPEINKSKSVWDPSLVHQVWRELPSLPSSTPRYECRRPLFSELRWRRRKMNIKRRRKYLKKMFYKIQTRMQNKAKRYQDLCNMLADINEKKTNLFDPKRFIDRELEKARFYGYKCTPVYDQFREAIAQGVKSFDEKYTRKFDDPREPLHIKLDRELLGNNKK